MRNEQTPKVGIRHLRRALELLAIGTILVGAGSCVTTRVAGGAGGAIVPAEAHPTFAAAVADYYHGSFNRSIEMLRRLMAGNPHDLEARWEIVSEYQEAGEYGKAGEVLRDLAASSADPAKVQQELFVNRYLAGDLKGARELLPLSIESAHSLFYEGLLYLDSGDRLRAISLLRSSLALREWHPMAWYFLGKLLYASAEYAGAEKSFERVLRQDPDLTIALVPLARAILARGEDHAAYPLLLRAREILPNDGWIAMKITELQDAHPILAEKRAQARATAKRTLVPPRVAAVPPQVAASRIVRVGLSEELRSITLKTGGPFVIRSASPGGAPLYRGAGDQLIVVRSEGKGIILSDAGKEPFLSWSAPVTLEYGDPRCTTLIFDLVSERGSFYAATGNPAYRGTMEFRPDREGFAVINALPLEEYLYSVLPSEMPAFWPMAALKAQAVAARSYTLASLGTFASRGYDLAGSVVSAAYGGVGSESAATTEAVNATAGQVLLFEGRPLEAFYSANSGGYSENSTVVWGELTGMEAVPDLLTAKRASDLPLTALISWLRGDPSSYSAIAPYYSRAAYRWEKWVPAQEIARRVERQKAIGRVLSIITRGRGISGRVAEVEVIGADGTVFVRGDLIRYALGGLRSTLFTVRPKLGPNGLPQYFIFTGGGWGHGVGMDQSGAAGMASAGYTYQEILSHYYPRARLETLDAAAGEPTE